MRSSDGARYPQTLVTLGSVDTDDLLPPWCIAFDGDEIASIAITVRLGQKGAEIGVTTVPEFRSRGFGAAAVAGWASHPVLSGRFLFYGASSANISSQRVTERLGLMLIGTNFSIT